MKELQLISVGIVVLIFGATLFLVGYALWKYIETKRWQRKFHREEAQKRECFQKLAPDLYEEIYGAKGGKDGD